MHEGSTNPRLKQELRSASGLALRATEVTAQSLGKVMSILVVQERHLWLSHAERSDVDKVSFLDALVSQAGLFGDTVEDCAQQFSAVQKQTEAIQHILPRCEAPSATAPPQGKPLSARRRGRPPVSSRAAPPRAESSPRPARRASRRSVAPPVFQLAPISSREAISGPDTGNPEMWEAARSQEMARRAGGESFILFRHRADSKSNFPFLRVLRLAGRQCATHCLLTLARVLSCQRPRECGWGTQGLPTRL